MRGIDNQYSFLLLIAGLILFAVSNSNFARDGILLRVNILGKYKPEQLVVTPLNKNLKPQSIDLDSQLPLTIHNSESYRIDIPGVNLHRRYPGTVHITRHSGYLMLINTLPLEEYVHSVVLSEMGLQDIEAMRSQAVLARTWAVTHLRPHRAYDFNDLTNSQSYKGLFARRYSIKQNIAVTRGKILAYQGQPIQVYYHSQCAERAYSAYEIWGTRKYPYYPRIQLPKFTGLATQNWTRLISRRQLDKIFMPNKTSPIATHYRKTTINNRHGVYVNTRWYDIDSFRIQVNRHLGWNQIRSNHFSLTEQGENLLFHGQGLGHLVGMCQTKAMTLARHGWNYQRILSLFYPGTELIAMSL